MTDTPDPAEAAAAAIATTDTGGMGTSFSFRGEPLNRYSVHHMEAYARLSFDDMTAREAAALFVYLCTKDGRTASAIRGDKALADFRFAATEWTTNKGSPRQDMVAEMIKLKDDILADLAKADSVAPVTKGTSLGNA